MHGYLLRILSISYNDKNEAYHPAKYLHVAMDMPTWVLRARVYTAPESIDSIVASSSLSLWSVRAINLSLFIKDHISSNMLQQNLSMRSASFIIMAPRSRAFILPHSPGLFLFNRRDMDLVKEKWGKRQDYSRSGWRLPSKALWAALQARSTSSLEADSTFKL